MDHQGGDLAGGRRRRWKRLLVICPETSLVLRNDGIIRKLISLVNYPRPVPTYVENVYILISGLWAVKLLGSTGKRW